MLAITMATEAVEPGSLEPIAVQVTRHLCPYCHRGRSSKRAAKLHMPKCWRNPQLQGCKTCALYRPGVWAGKPAPGKVTTGAKTPGTCGAGFNLGPGLVTKCRKWVLDPALTPATAA